VKESHHRLILRFDSPQSVRSQNRGRAEHHGRRQGMDGHLQRTTPLRRVAAVARAGGRVVAEDLASLDEIFVAWSGKKSA
jgi:hypothetical protein